MSNQRTIAYVSGTRADYGLMELVLQKIQASDHLTLDLYATGMHLMSQRGETILEMQKTFPQVKRIEAIIADDQLASQAKFFADLSAGIVAAFTVKRPDIVLVLGDRVETLCVATVCLYLGIPVAHIHGGERTSTADEVARHAITKLSSLHFAATQDAAERIIKLGEDRTRVVVSGAPGLDAIVNQALPNISDVFGRLQLPLIPEFILVTMHAVTHDWEASQAQMRAVLGAVERQKLPAIIIYPNTDPGGQAIIEVIEAHRSNPLFYSFKNVAYHDFLALEKAASAWVGNSSAGIIESASFQTPVVNVGPRQANRLRPANVIDVDYDMAQISQALEKCLHDASLKQTLATVTNPWGDGHASERIVTVLESIEINQQLLSKQITY